MDNAQESQYALEQSRRMRLIDLMGGDRGLSQLGVVAITTIPQGLRVLFGHPTFAIAEISFSEAGWALNTVSPHKFSWCSLTDKNLISTVHLMSTPAIVILRTTQSGARAS